MYVIKFRGNYYGPYTKADMNHHIVFGFFKDVTQFKVIYVSNGRPSDGSHN